MNTPFSNLTNFLSNPAITQCPLTGCLYLEGATKRPCISFHGVSTPVYRVMAEATIRELCTTDVVRHKCDNGFCFNPEHLELGNIRENNQDKGNFSTN